MTTDLRVEPEGQTMRETEAILTHVYNNTTIQYGTQTPR